MNLLLFEPAETSAPLSRRDPRAAHLLGVLKRRVGDTFDAGLIDGPHGKGTLVAIGDDALTLTFAWGPPPPPSDPITLIVGLPRPQTARDILRDATTLGVAAIHFVATDKGEPSYAQSSLWHSGEWRRHVRLGAEQAFATRLPVVTHGRPLAAALDALASPAPPLASPPKSGPGDPPTATDTRLALDNYESPAALSVCHVIRDKPVVLAIGSERGWSAAERDALRAAGFTFAHLGTRVLRTETACLAALTLVRAKLGLL